jgi:integrase
MGRKGSGVEVRPGSIRLTFTWQGQAHKETLITDGKPVPPTPRSIAFAERTAAEIREKIKHGTFVFAEYFPASRHATTGQGTTVADQLDLWLSLQIGKASSTLKGYRVAVEWWKDRIGSKTLRALVHSDVLAALASEPTWTGKTRNNKVSPLRQALALAIRDGVLKSSPVEGLEASKHQKPPPDPFSREEAEAILADLREHYHPQIALYFEIKFFTGMRTSESLGLRWDSIDWRRGQMTVREGIVLGEHIDRTKTHAIRQVQLNSRALAALKAQKAHTFLLQPGWVFTDPRTGKRWIDDEGPRENFWRPALKRLGIRYRSPYETRHTYATIMLMAGVRPAYGARQLGHSVEQFLRTYSKWIDGGENDVEMGKVEAAIAGAGESAGEESAQRSTTQRKR